MDEIIKKKPYMRLIYGTAGRCYVDAIKTIHKNCGNNTFMWKDLVKKTNINQSMLMRLKCSSWILISDKAKDRGTFYRIPTTWTLHPEAMNIVERLGDLNGR
jgi:hypothetical protein